VAKYPGSDMPFRRIVAATDDTETGHHSVVVAAGIAARTGATFEVLTVVGSPSDLSPSAAAEDLRRWLHSVGLDTAANPATVVVARGLPGIEIARYGEEQEVDLLVLGRQHRTQAERLVLGDTADALARRSRIPCLFIPTHHDGVSRVLAALDGTERGFRVMVMAADFARAVSGRLRAVTVERLRVDEPRNISIHMPDARSAKLSQAIDRLRVDEPVSYNLWEWPGEPAGGRVLRARQGEVVEEVLLEVTTSAADVLVIGYHRGGPPGSLEAGSIGRRLAHSARCAVLTVPL
jgi:nucleotide-binding universal stress UspA family protein